MGDLKQGRIAGVSMMLRQGGWDIASIDISLVDGRERLRLDIRRDDGRRVFVDGSPCRASITVTHLRMERVSIGAGGLPCGRGGFPSERPTEDLISRRRYEGVRSAMRSLANYLSDNALRPLPSIASRDCMRALLTAVEA